MMRFPIYAVWLSVLSLNNLQVLKMQGNLYFGPDYNLAWNEPAIQTNLPLVSGHL